LKYITSILIAVLLLLSGCGSEKKVVVAKAKELPYWYKTPPSSTGTTLYSLGEGKNKQEAITNALTYMASTLSVSVSSTFAAKTVVKEGRVNTNEATYVSDSHSEVKKIRISNYDVVQAESLGFKHFAVIIKSDKKKLFDSMKQEIEQEFSIIKQKKETLKNANSLSQLTFYRESEKSLRTLPDTLIVMNALNSNFNGNTYIRESQEISANYQNLLQKVSFNITANENANNLRSPVAKGLSQKNFKIDKNRGPSHFEIKIYSKIVYATSYGFSLARSEISIITKDSRGTIVGSNSLNITGQSSQGSDIAKQNVSFKLNALIKKDGISKVLGLDI